MKLKAVLYIAIFLFALEFSLAEVVVFSNYETDTSLQDGNLHIERTVTLQNVGTNPIIPGELHFKLHEIEKGKKLPSKVSNFAAVNDYKTELKARVLEGDEETDLIISIWEPVLPKFSYRIKLQYDLQFEPTGLLFYELNVPVEQTTIPIKNQNHNLFLDSGYHVTYAPSAVVKTVSKGDGGEYRMVSWDNKEDMVVEYSRLPLPKLGIKAVNLFWGVIIIAMLVLTFLLHRKMRKI